YRYDQYSLHCSCPYPDSCQNDENNGNRNRGFRGEAPAFKLFANTSVHQQVFDTCNQVVQQSRQDAPDDQLRQEAVQQLIHPVKAIFSGKGEIQAVHQEGNTYEDDDAADTMQDRSNGWQREMKLAEIEIYWSFAIH